MRKRGIVRVFIVEYQEGRGRRWWPESLSGEVAMRLGRELAVRGCKPTVRRLDVPNAELRGLMARFGIIAESL